MDKTINYSKLSRSELEELDTSILDKAAFGFNIGDIIRIKTSDLKYSKDEIVNAEYKYELGGMDWVRSVDFSEPIKIVFEKDGKFHIEDGHHRFFASKKLGLELTAEIEDIKLNTIDAILKKPKRSSKKKNKINKLK